MNPHFLPRFRSSHIFENLLNRMNEREKKNEGWTEQRKNSERFKINETIKD